MKVTIDGKEFFNVDTNDMPETINITKETLWTDKWALFALCCLLSGENNKINRDTLEELIQKRNGETE